MKLYNVIQTLFNNNTQNSILSIDNTILDIFTTSNDCINYINNITKIYVNPENYYIVTKTQYTPPTEDDIDGLYLINKNTENSDDIDKQFNIYLKQTKQQKGYMYNSYDINIKHIGIINICSYDNFECNCTNYPLKQNYSASNKTTFIDANIINKNKKNLNFESVIKELKLKLKQLDKLKID